MRIFEQVKEAVTVLEAARYYGLKVTRNGMVCCPFHNDKHPSMKLNRDYFFCFGCGARGDVIDLVAKLFGLSNYEAAKKLAQDFGIDPDPGAPPVAAVNRKIAYFRKKAVQEELQECHRVVCDYLHLLDGWKFLYAPMSPAEGMDERFEEACERYSYIEYLADYLTFAEEEEQIEAMEQLQKDGTLQWIRDRLAQQEKEGEAYGEQTAA